jgi:peptidoglycan/LPS O-acetylase OafA/YrhL
MEMERVIPRRLEYQPALDGLRGLAVLAVMIYHQGHLAGGFLGVDVFFVLSGFLITTLLLMDRANTGRLVSASFWVRRARRLLPALVLFLVIVGIYAVTVAPHSEIGAIWGGSLATLFYFQNYWLIHHPVPGDYPLSHTWSLSIEEQFYLVWPVTIAFLVRFLRGRLWVVAMTSILIIASVSLMLGHYDHGQVGAAYLSTGSRGQELLVGAVLAFMLFGRRGPRSRAGQIGLEVAGFGAIGVVVVCVFTVTTTSAWLFKGGFLAIAASSAVLVAAAITPTSTRLRAVLSMRILVAVGLISYGLYLYHVPLDSFVNAQTLITNEAALVLMRFGASVAVAGASYVWVERPIRRSALTFGLRRRNAGSR